ncbi:MAG TPA: hypothetical protein VH352_20725 [Pseudonocardiaceae bacterium]|nr:hypothetical protein [Pseudonocardiaceae bacterium]
MTNVDGRSVPGGGFSRRTALKTAGLASALATLEMVGRGTKVPVRLANGTVNANVALPDIQFDIGNFIPPAQTEENGVVVRFGPINTTFLTAKLTRNPTTQDQQSLSSAMNALEFNYPFSAGGIFTFISYGIPYFNRLPGGLKGSLVSNHMPRLTSNNARFALEEAVPSPTDVSPSNPTIVKQRYNVPVAIENNDVLITIRGDDSSYVADVVNWFGGSNTLAARPVPSPTPGLFHFTSSRAMFQAMGLPRYVAGANGLPFAPFIHPMSPMWMGFADQQVHGSGPAPITTFLGNASAKVTNAHAGDYFDNGSIQHLSHDILDMFQFFDLDANGNPGSDGTFLERVQYMFRSTPPPSFGNADQFYNGGGPCFLETVFQGTNDAINSAMGIGTGTDPATGLPQHRIGHLSGLQRSSRAADGTPMHIRMDGAGFDNLDVPDGSNQPKLEFTVFVPSADFFATMRSNAGCQDLVSQFNIANTDNGLERFITATRRQNFLIPPRRHRAFPLLELA